ncbi:MoxR family ATPase [Iamia sp. SCSIO 61187]|uniref:AAA family ATPase n=1 Tax=Iamia sp. SCSIO 61187 TaxID=2722752 RepID=UPI001C63017D|nr:MoxR family ATPase [Iamia sp. SCSIO 61187]
MAALLDEVERVVVGKRAVLEVVLGGLLADGHVLLEDLPGVAKTLIAQTFAAASGLTFRRIQFTPDLLPADITGVSILDPGGGGFRFVPGPVFANVVLADEINRAPAKTQSALLEAMQERQVTADGATRDLPSPFLVIATQNPIEQEGTYALPEAQLDRFILRTPVGYPDRTAEVELIDRRLTRGVDAVAVTAVLEPGDLLAMQRSMEAVHVDPGIVAYAVDLAAATRRDERLAVGASPRGSLALIRLSRVRAVLSGRDFVLPDDVKAIAHPALEHRLLLTSDQWVRQVDPATILDEVLASVPAPTAR